MKRILVYLLFFLHFTSFRVCGQSLFQHYYEGHCDNFQSEIIVLPDSSILLVRQVMEERNTFFQLIKLNNYGDTLWTRSNYDTTLTVFYCITPADAGNYYIGGTFIPDSLPQYGVVAKINSSGNILWKKVMKDSVTTIKQITHLMNGDFLLGATYSPYYYNLNLMEIRTDGYFNKKWLKRIGGSYDSPSEVLEENNGNLLITTIGHGGGSSIIFFDSSGQSTVGIYQQRHLYGSAKRKNAVWKTNDTLISSLTHFSTWPDKYYKSQYWSANLSVSGLSTSQVVVNDSLLDFVNTIQRLPNKNFIVCGKKIKNLYESEMVVVMLDSLYHTVWSRTIHNYPIECAIATKITSDNRILVLGMYDTYFHTLHGFSITAMDSTGNIIGIQKMYANNQQNWTVYPNPAVDEIQFDLLGEIRSEGKLWLTIYNSIGRMVFTKEIQKTSSRVSTQTLSSGYYFFKIENISGKNFASGKFIVEK